MKNVTKLNEGLNKKELKYLIAYVEDSVRLGKYTVKNIDSLVSKNKDGSVRQNTSTTYEMADAWVEELKFLEPLLEKLQAY